MFESYAQNGEDIVLWRALGHIPGGRWIDVGANHPDVDSVTRVFSDAGWSGINIEPMDAMYALLCERRPRDVTLRVAIEDVDGEREYFAVGEGLGLSTGDADAADRYRRAGLSVDAVVVPVRTLTSVWDECVDGDVHFLKIDVEGAEERVLAGADLARHRPWVVVVESVDPVVMADAEEFDVRTAPQPTSRHGEWEHHLVDNDYRFVLFDGLNRFYVAAEHFDELGPRLAAPVNVLDRSEPASARRVRVALEEHLGQVERERESLAHELVVVTAERDVARAELATATSERIDVVAAMERTVSWRVTAPLRWIRRLLPG